MGRADPWAAGIVGDDGIGDIHRMHEVPDDAIGRQRHVVGGQFRQPLRCPFVFDLLDLRRYPMTIAHTGTKAVLHLTDQRLQGQLGIADERILAGTSLFRSAGSRWHG